MKNSLQTFRRLLLAAVVLTLCAGRAAAVLNERNLAQSLSVLRVELEQAYKQQKQNMARWEQMNEAQHQMMIDIMKKSNQIALMIYSQRDDYVFDLTYACHEATQQYFEFRQQRVPYDRIRQRMETEIERYNGLIEALEQLPPSLRPRHHAPMSKADSLRRDSLRATRRSSDGEPILLDAKGQADRDRCLVYAKALRNNIIRMQQRIDRDSNNYKLISQHLKKLNDYAAKRYHDIQQNIFQNAGVTYPTMLAKLPLYIKYAKKDVHDKYSSTQEYRGVHSEWRGPVVMGFVFFVMSYLVLSIILSVTIVTLLMRYVKRFRTDRWRRMKPCLTMAAGVLIFAVSIMGVSFFVTHNNFYSMASSLLVEYAWLLTAIFVSLLVRFYDGENKREKLRQDEDYNGSEALERLEPISGFRLYSPIVLMGLIIIIFRIVFIPNNLVNLLFPPIVLVFTLWQWREVKKRSGLVPNSDRIYTYISLGVMIVSTVAAMVGYTLLAVEIFIWWLFQLTAIQTITLAFTLLGLYEERKLKKKLLDSGLTEKEIATGASRGDYITQTWFFDLVEKALVPIAAAYSVLLCIYLAADVFDLSQICLTIFLTPFLDVPDVIQLSLFKLVIVGALFFLFRYLSYLLKSMYRYIRIQSLLRKSGDRKVRTNEINLTLGYNIIMVIVWGLFASAAIVLLRIPKSGISIVTAGLATGVGFAMKDLLNNFFYGVSLMTGRLRVGDWIECDGVQGKVESITYQSTQIITTDDCVMAFLNSTLFAKNFKNLTRNHSYELIKIPVGVAYGSNVGRVREVLVNEVMQLQRNDKYERPIINPARGVVVLFDNFGDSSVDLIVATWVLVEEKVGFKSQAKEIIYNTLNREGIEIPFPQRDVHVKGTLPSEH